MRAAILSGVLACALVFVVYNSQTKLESGMTMTAMRGGFTACARPQVVRNMMTFAHKKGSGSTENGRDSNSKRLGLKVTHGKVVPAGSIIFRQRGQRVHPGKNVAVGKDYTLFATKTGVVKFSNQRVNNGPKHKRIRKVAHIVPEEPVAEVAVESL
eukprot:CAMPEP_0170169342 /NCGR_PEP_ID=MMETSP0040_2-20121228/2250_1 /TAXON_ID=641309 /ORGANISM="Lotharella oceanica, Strain CCMP622" /LENGTH=155 /DNA_ID=CAMNT_0010408013 /DNA_START=25 /DNA_END=492 /DNA_ORIENTATION=-